MAAFWPLPSNSRLLFGLVFYSIAASEVGDWVIIAPLADRVLDVSCGWSGSRALDSQACHERAQPVTLHPGMVGIVDDFVHGPDDGWLSEIFADKAHQRWQPDNLNVSAYEINALPEALEGNMVELFQRVHGYLNRHVRSASAHKQGPWAYAGTYFPNNWMFRRYRGKRRMAAHVDTGNYARCLSAVLFIGQKNDELEKTGKSKRRQQGVSGGVFRTLRCKTGNCSIQKGWQYDATFKDIPSELTQDNNLEVLAEVLYKPGRLVFFLAETLHDVTEVAAGSRKVLFMWFTCQPTLLNGVGENGHVALVEYLLSQGAAATEKFGVEAMGGKKPQIIHHAAAFGRSDLVRILVRHRAEAAATTTDGVQPIHLASAHSDVINTLLTYRAEISALNEAGEQPMHFATKDIAGRGGHVKAIELLVSHRAKVSVAGKDGTHPMHIAAGIGSVNALSTLAGRRASVTVRQGYGAQPMHLAAYEGHLDVVKWLLNQDAPVTEASSGGELPLNLAISQGHNSVASLLRPLTLHSRQASKRTDL